MKRGSGRASKGRNREKGVGSGTPRRAGRVCCDFHREYYHKDILVVKEFVVEAEGDRGAEALRGGFRNVGRRSRSKSPGAKLVPRAPPRKGGKVKTRTLEIGGCGTR
jgi:hypothetical protein